MTRGNRDYGLTGLRGDKSPQIIRSRLIPVIPELRTCPRACLHSGLSRVSRGTRNIQDPGLDPRGELGRTTSAPPVPLSRPSTGSGRGREPPLPRVVGARLRGHEASRARLAHRKRHPRAGGEPCKYPLARAFRIAARRLNPRTGRASGWCRRARGWWRAASPGTRSAPRSSARISPPAPAAPPSCARRASTASSPRSPGRSA